MTTLVGIVAGKGKQGVILGSDLSRTQTQWGQQGEVAYRQVTKAEGQKIYVDKNREVALCMAGVWDNQYKNFRDAILNGDIDIRKVIKTGYFQELSDLNHSRWEGKYPKPELFNGLLIATRFDGDPKLYSCWPLGRVEEKKYTAVGSGSDYVLRYLIDQDTSIPGNVDLEKGIDLVSSSLDKASQDIYTSGMDLVVATEKDMLEFSKDIKAALEHAKKGAIERIKRKARRPSS